MAACILCDPLFAGASAEHGRIITDAFPLFDMVSAAVGIYYWLFEKVAAVPGRGASDDGGRSDPLCWVRWLSVLQAETEKEPEGDDTLMLRDRAQ